MTTLIISEKPKAAERIASALSDGHLEKGKRGKAVWFEIMVDGKRVLVVPAVGHLYNLKQKGDGKWTYPVFETEWVPSYEVSKNSAFSKAYLYNFKKLSGEADDFIVATDYDSEGSVIGYNILRFVCGTENAKRMKFSTLTAVELRESYRKASPKLDFPQIEAGIVRHKLDWLYGINTSRALTLAIKKASNYFKILSTGRIQGPALKIVARREKEIRKFVPKPFWELEAELKAEEKILAKHKEGKFWEKGLAEEIKKRCEGGKAVVSDISKKKYKHNPPHPFDLTALQTEAHSSFGFNPKQTLEVAQSLYDSGLISYPRTSSQKLPARLGLKNIVQKIGQQKAYRELAEKVLKGKLKPNEGKKDDPAHPSIFPTGETPKKMNKWEKKLYDMIVRRFLAVFGEPAVRETIDVVFDINSELFVAKGKRTLEKNWIEFYEKYVNYEEQLLPPMKKGDVLDVLKVVLLEKETQPPNRYNQASLLKELEKLNLGTKATRAHIIHTLYERGYVRGNQIEVTELGFAVVDTLEKYCPEMLSEELTKEFEEDMDEVEKGLCKKEKIIERAIKTLSKILGNFKENELKIGEELQEALIKTRNDAYVLGECPKCGHNLRIIISRASKKRFVGCEGYKEGCRESFPLPQSGKIEHSGKCKECGLPVIKVIRKGRRPYTMCIDPKCPSKADWNKKPRKKQIKTK
ncbi:MAG: DNA topoisomerase I [archaeon]|nr:MAG: DNA topoisomerase I [archaeon]